MKRTDAEQQLRQLAHALRQASRMLSARQLRTYRVSSCQLRSGGGDLLTALAQRHGAGESLQQIADWLDGPAIDELVVEDG
jgi:hypothetical protein